MNYCLWYVVLSYLKIVIFTANGQEMGSMHCTFSCNSNTE